MASIVFLITMSTFLMSWVIYLLIRKADEIMATLKELNDTLDEVAAGVNGLEAAIADLKKQVVAGSAVTQADLDALAAKAAAIGDDIKDTSDQG